MKQDEGSILRRRVQNASSAFEQSKSHMRTRMHSVDASGDGHWMDMSSEKWYERSRAFLVVKSILFTIVLSLTFLAIHIGKCIVSVIKGAGAYFVLTIFGDRGNRFVVGGHPHSLMYSYFHEQRSHALHSKVPWGISGHTKRPFTLVLDLDETLVHTSNSFVRFADLRVEVVQKKRTRIFYVVKRPFLDVFMEIMSRYFDIVIYTASIRRYADPVIDLIDLRGVIKKRLFRESCIPMSQDTVSGPFVKDLKKVSTDLSKMLIVDNSPEAYSMFKHNGFHIKAWFDDANDTELLRIIPFLVGLQHVKDVRSLLSRRDLRAR